MSEELYFNDELRKCLNAAGLSDCGENDAWNYWYHRVHKAHDQAVDRVTEAQRAENAKLREELEAVGTAAYLYGRTDLEAENAKLRESVKRLMTQRDGRLARAEADNAKLRELVRSMYDVLDVTIDWSELDDDMRELGVDE